LIYLVASFPTAVVTSMLEPLRGYYSKKIDILLF